MPYNTSAVPHLSVVVPVYQAEACLHALYQGLTDSLAKLSDGYEILLVDDSSLDASWGCIQQLAEEDHRVKGIRLSRNFGQSYAITAGLEHSRGEWIVVMDCDLQDPPEAIATLYRKAMEGYDVVYARRQNRQDPLWKKWMSKAYYALINHFMHTKVDDAIGSFTLMSRKVANAFLSLREPHRHYLVLLRWLGFKQAIVDVTHGKRYAGNSAYSFPKLLLLAVDGIISQTTLLLRWMIQLGFLSAFGAMLYMGYIVYLKLRYPTVPVGWPSLMCAVLFMGGAILTSIGVLGLYIDKIFTQTKHRPLYLVDEAVNLEALMPDEHGLLDSAQRVTGEGMLYRSR